MLDAATLAIQELLKHYSRAEGLEALQQQQGASGGAPSGASGEAKGWGAASGQRETTPAAVEGNLLFGALPGEVQVRWAGLGHAELDWGWSAVPNAAALAAVLPISRAAMNSRLQPTAAISPAPSQAIVPLPRL